MPQLTIKKGSRIIGEPKFFPDDTDIISIGRSPSNDIRLSDTNLERPKISKCHAAIIKNKQGKYFVRDLGSKNGTRINGTMVYRGVLKDNDEIQIGDFVLKFEESAGSKGKIKIRFVEEEEWFKSRYLSDTTANIPTMYEETYVPPDKLKEIAPERSNYKDSLEDIYKLIKSITDLQTLLNEIVTAIFDLLRPGRGYIICKGENNALIPTVVKGFDTELSLPLLKSMQETVLGRGGIFQSRANLALGIPLKKGADVFGLLYLEKESGFSDEDINLMKLFADYFSKHIKDTQQKIEHGEKPISAENFDWKAAIVGNRKTVEQIYKQIDAMAMTDDNVLILGETRTGKELMARDIHKISSRKGEFIEINISKSAETWLEDDLFGREDRVAHGAKAKRGVFELADKGTLFLDEIGDLKIDYQNKILKILENKVITRMGGERTTPVDVKIIAATNKDLKKGMQEKWFREDLYYRFTHKIEVLPLREKKDDIPLLAHYFLDKYSGKYSTRTKGISHKGMKLLMNYDWPGNVGELENCIASAISKNKNKVILLPDDFPIEIREKVSDKTTERKGIRELVETEREEIKKALEATKWNVSEAARKLGISHAGIHLKMKKYGLKRPEKN